PDVRQFLGCIGQFMTQLVQLHPQSPLVGFSAIHYNRRYQPVRAVLAQQCLYFLPLPQGQGSFLPTFWRRIGCRFGASSRPWLWGDPPADACLFTATSSRSRFSPTLAFITYLTTSSWISWTICSNIS